MNSLETLRSLSVDNPGPIALGDSVTATLRIPNASPESIRDVIVSWSTATGLRLITSGTSRRAAGAVIEEIAPGEVATVTATYRAIPCAVVDEVSIVGVSAVVAIGKQQVGTNTASIVIIRKPRLAATAVSTVDTDGTASWTISVMNEGAARARNVLAVLQIPRNVEISLVPEGCTRPSGQLELHKAWLDPGESATFSVEGTMRAADGGEALRTPEVVVVAENHEAVPVRIADVSFVAANLDCAGTKFFDTVDEQLVVGGMRKIRVFVRNDGFRAPARDVRVGLRVTGTACELVAGSMTYRENALLTKRRRDVIVVEIPEIRGEGEEVVSFDVIGRGVGSSTIEATIEHGGAAVKRLITLSVDGVPTVTGAFEGAPATCAAGASFSVMARVRNDGSVPASGVLVTLGGSCTQPSTEVLGELGAGESRLLELSAIAESAGDVECRLVVVHDADSGDRVLDTITLGAIADPRVVITSTCANIVVGHDGELRTTVRNIGNARARNVALAVYADGPFSVAVVPEPVAFLEPNEEVILSTQLHLEADSAVPLVARAVATHSGGVVAAAPVCFSAIPDRRIGELCFGSDVVAAQLGKLVAFDMSFQSLGKSTIDELSVRASLAGCTFVVGSLAINGHSIIADMAFGEDGIRLQHIPTGAKVALKWLGRVADVGEWRPRVQLRYDGREEEASLALSTTNPSWSGAAAAIGVDVSALPAAHVEEILPAAAVLVHTSTAIVLNALPGVHDPDLQRAPSAPSTSPERPADENAAPDGMRALEVTPVDVAQAPVARDLEPEAPAAAVPLALTDEAPIVDTQPLESGEVLETEIQAPPIEEALDPTLEVPNVTTSNVTALAPVTDAEFEALMARIVPVTGVTFGLDLAGNRLAKLVTYLEVARSSAGGCLIRHPLSVRAFFPTHMIGSGAPFADPVISVAQSRVAETMDSIQMRLAMKLTDVSAGDLESMSLRTSILELVRGVMLTEQGALATPPSGTWLVGLVDPRGLEKISPDLERAALGSATALAAMFRFAGTRFVGLDLDASRADSANASLVRYLRLLNETWTLFGDDDVALERALMKEADPELEAAADELLSDLVLLSRSTSTLP